MISNYFQLVVLVFIVFVTLLTKKQSVFGKSILPNIAGSLVNNNHIQVKKLPSLNWSPNNHLFNDHQSINYYLKLNAHIGDSIDLVCGGGDGNSNHQNTHSIIYKVSSKHEFDNCIVNPQHAETVPILKCGTTVANNQENIQNDSHHHQQVKFTIYFVKFSPVPNALEFEEDKEYYFLSTSSGTREGLNYMSGGLCSNFNMRFSIKIDSTANSHHEDSQHSTLVKQQHLSQFQSSVLSSMNDYDSTKLTPYNSNDKSHTRLSKNGGSQLIGNTNRREDSEKYVDEDVESERAKERLTKYQPQVSSKLNIASSSSRCRILFLNGRKSKYLSVVFFIFYCLFNRLIRNL